MSNRPTTRGIRRGLLNIVQLTEAFDQTQSRKGFDRV